MECYDYQVRASFIMKAIADTVVSEENKTSTVNLNFGKIIIRMYFRTYYCISFEFSLDFIYKRFKVII